ncbi:ester cyclase [Streptomyces sp. NPDC002845]
MHGAPPGAANQKGKGSHVHRDQHRPRAPLLPGPGGGGLLDAHRPVPPRLRIPPQIDTPRPGAEGFIDAEKKHVEAFPGLTLTVVDTVAEGDKVGAYVVVEGDQAGDFYCSHPASASRNPSGQPAREPRPGTPCGCCSPP